jgi:hypothetical protein
MSYSAVGSPAIPLDGLKGTGYGRENAPGGPGDSLETQSLVFGLDLASDNGDAS